MDKFERESKYGLLKGVYDFLDFAFQNSAKENKILCPCRKCVNAFFHTKSVVMEHLFWNGFQTNYVIWIYHGETLGLSNANDLVNEEDRSFDHDIDGLLGDAFMDVNMEENDLANFDEEGDINLESSPPLEKHKIFELVKDAGQPLYPACQESKLAAVLMLYHLKCLHGWSNKSFSELLEYLKFLLPKGNVLPKSHYETKKIVAALNLGYEKIHACPNDCMLFWKDKKDDDVCSVCGSSRWVIDEVCDRDVEESTAEIPSANQKRKPAKVLRWFPLKPRLQRLFMCSETSAHMRWHDECRTKDHILRHPADSKAWKDFDSKHPDFAVDPRNVRLGLASDGFNPFKNMSVAHSTWPVVIIPYNLPPWLCMKQTNFILTLLIPGPKSPGNKIDVYLQPLIEELKDLWEHGIETWDASMNETFRMQAGLLWTINDFLGLAMLSGWSTRGKYACPCCCYDTKSLWLYNSGKYSYMGHRRWLPCNHKFRKESEAFDGTKEPREAPPRTSGSDLLAYALDAASSIAESGKALKKTSIFFQLPYWEHNLLRHNIDIMHTEKNVFDNCFGTILEQAGKNKDNYKSRLDLVALGIRRALHPKACKKKPPKALYQMNTKEKEAFLTALKQMKLPDEFSSNISHSIQVEQRKIIGLKSYDCHILMEELLPVAIRGCLPKEVTSVLVDLCHLFKCLCAKVLKPSDLDKLQSQAAVILCEMEQIFPPAFFTIMVHLIIHLVEEAKLGGPVFYRWMYPIERYLLTLKNFVRNRAHPEGSIAEGYLANECLTFCSRYLGGVETRFKRPLRNNDGFNLLIDLEEEPSNKPLGRPIGRKASQKIFNVRKRKRVTRKKLDSMALFQEHRYVLFNCEEVKPFRLQHKDLIKRQNRSRRLSEFDIEKHHSTTFNEWFKEQVAAFERQGINVLSERIKCLARGPDATVVSYNGYLINGYRFHTKKHEKKLKTQNSGVAVISSVPSYSSRKDKRPIEGEVNYYGVLNEILQLNYSGMLKVVLFKCDWVNTRLGSKRDEYGFTLVNFGHLSHQGNNIGDDPYILASQASKVFYVKDFVNKGWHVVKHVKVRDALDLGVVVSVGEEQAGRTCMTIDKDSTLVRPDCSDDEEIDEVPGMEDQRCEEQESDDDADYGI